jgi:hypothetical protein
MGSLTMRLPFLRFGALFGRKTAPTPSKPVMLADVDPVIADLDRREMLAQIQHRPVRPIREARKARVHAHLERGRA